MNRVRAEYQEERWKDLRKQFEDIMIDGVSTISKIDLFAFIDMKVRGNHANRLGGSSIEVY